LRVPYLQDGVARHPAGILGVAAVSVVSGALGSVERLGKVYDALLGRENPAVGSEWDVKTLAGEALHSGGRVRITAEDGAAGVSITLFTTAKEFAGRKVGGDVGDGLVIEFQLVAAH
jgi:hypothetical protein